MEGFQKKGSKTLIINYLTLQRFEIFGGLLYFGKLGNVKKHDITLKNCDFTEGVINFDFQYSETKN